MRYILLSLLALLIASPVHAERENFRLYTGSYVGNSVNFRFVTIPGANCVPRMVWNFPDSTDQSSMKLDVHVNSPINIFGSSRLSSTAASDVGGAYYSLEFGGFRVGIANDSNLSGVTYHYVAFCADAHSLATGRFTGNGATDRDIIDPVNIPFKIGTMGIKNSSTNNYIMRNSTVNTANTGIIFSAATANTSQTIISIATSSQFRVGTNAAVNGNNVNIWYWAMPEMPREIFNAGTYVGTGVAGNEIDIGFTPDLFLVKSTNAAGVGAVKTATMPTNGAKIANVSAVTADIVTGTTTRGVTLGTAVNSNQAGTTYQWMAWKGGDHWLQTATRTPRTTVRYASTTRQFVTD